MRTIKKYFFPIAIIAAIFYIVYTMILPKILMKQFISKLTQVEPGHRETHKAGFEKYGDDFYTNLIVWNYKFGNTEQKSRVSKVLYDYAYKKAEKLGILPK